MSAITSSNPTHQLPLRQIARIAGVLYIIIIVAGMFAGGFVRPELLVKGDVAATAENIIASEGLFRASIVADLAMIIADVAIAVAFYYLLKPVNQGLSLLSAVFRLAQAATLGINLLMLFFVLQLLSGEVYTPVLGEETVQAQAYLFLTAHSIGYKLALMFFAFSILIQGYLLYVSGYFPKILGGLMVVAAAGYFIDNMATFILPNYDDYAATFEMIVMIALPVELGMALWLLIKGIRTEQLQSGIGMNAPRAEAVAN
ncbi:MAG: DUF4386 domain-containing protein [Chloroflexi bacterium]|nr:DUF4386 domain-containing protein [Chloroflexota bacterium]